jgi:hypothetical protein
MTLRIEIQPDLSIEIMRPRGDHSQFLSYSNLDSAMIVIKYFIRRDLAQASGERFTSQATMEARKAFKLLQEKANAEIQSRQKSAGSSRYR